MQKSKPSNSQTVSSFQLPNDVAMAAKILLDNHEFRMVMSFKRQELAQEVMQYAIPDEVLEAHGEYKSLERFTEWLQYAAEQA